MTDVSQEFANGAGRDLTAAEQKGFLLIMRDVHWAAFEYVREHSWNSILSKETGRWAGFGDIECFAGGIDNYTDEGELAEVNAYDGLRIYFSDLNNEDAKGNFSPYRIGKERASIWVNFYPGIGGILINAGINNFSKKFSIFEGHDIDYKTETGRAKIVDMVMEQVRYMHQAVHNHVHGKPLDTKLALPAPAI